MIDQGFWYNVSKSNDMIKHIISKIIHFTKRKNELIGVDNKINNLLYRVAILSIIYFIIVQFVINSIIKVILALKCYKGFKGLSIFL